MENLQSPQEQNNSQKPYRNSNRSLAGLFIIAIGILLFVHILGRQFLWFPGWLFTWPMILIAIGVFSGLRNNFQSRGWLILILIGSFFLISREIPDYNLERFTAPFVLVIVGFVMLFRPRRHCRNRFDGDDFWDDRRRKWQAKQDRFTSPPPSSSNSDTATFTTESATTNNSSAEYLGATAILGHAKKAVFSKNFTGGDITCFMGGADIDLSNADIQGKARIDITCFMGGAKFIVPPHWNVYSDATAIMGGIDDKRTRAVALDPNKTLIIDGICIMGGVEINSF